MATQTIIQASVLYGPKDLRSVSREVASPAAGEVQVSVRATGICGSDQHYYNHFRNGDILVREPMALGHESAGVVEAVGPDVVGFQPGDRVALEVGLPCGACGLCSKGSYNICRDMKFRSSAKAFPHFQGTLQERINHPAKWCHKLPETVTLAQGALLEPLSVAIHAVRRANTEAGALTLVLGAGAVGLLTAAMLRVKGAARIVIADIEASRVDFATANGFADTGFVVPRRQGRSVEENLAIAQELAKSVQQALGEAVPVPSQQFDAVFECTGVEACLQAAIYAAGPGGKVMLIGMGNPIQTLPISAAALREVDIVGVFRYANTYAYGIELLADWQASLMPDISKLITHRFRGLENITKAFEMAGKPKDDKGGLVVKVFIEL